jgi:hypothetical protein
MAFVKDPTTNSVYSINQDGSYSYVSDPNQVNWNDTITSAGPIYTAEAARKLAENTYNPQLETGLQSIQQSGLGFDQNETDINRNYDRLSQTLQEQADATRRAFEERQNQLGLLTSGGTAAGLGKISSDLVRSQTESAQDKASRLASLAIQRAGLKTQETALRNTTSQSINDMVAKLLTGSRQDVAASKKALEEQNALSTLDLGDRIVMIDKNGNIVKEYAKRSLSGGGSNPFAGLNLGGDQNVPSATTTESPKIGNFPISDLMQNQVQGRNEFIVDGVDHPLTREELADIVSGNQLRNADGRKTKLWNTVYGQIINAFPDVAAATPKNTIASFIPIPGQKTTKLRGF